MTDVPDYLDRRDFFKKPQISDTEYIVYNGFSKIVYQVYFDKWNLEGSGLNTVYND